MSRTTTAITAIMPQLWDRILLDNLYPDLFSYQFGEKRRVPRGFGKAVNYTRYFKAGGSLQLPTFLTEGVPTFLSQLSAATLTATLSGYGSAIGLSDLVVMTAVSDTVRGGIYELSKGMALKIERIIRMKVLSGAGGKIWAKNTAATSSQTISTTSTLKGSDLPRVVGKLRQNLARPWPDGNYAAIFHPRVAADIKADSAAGGWIDVNKYATNQTVEQIYRGEIGRLFGLRCVESAEAHQILSAGYLSASASGFISEAIAPGAYGVTELDGAAASVFVKQVGSAGALDALNQLGSVGVKVYFAPFAMDMANRAVRIISGGKPL